MNSTLRLVKNPTRKNPEIIPLINGIVFAQPYRVPFMEQSMLFGPGEKLRKTM
jgi:hypothetical protein